MASSAARANDREIALAREMSSDLGLRRPIRLLQSAEPALLVTWGFRRPAIVLPAGAAEWPEERLRVALRHELAHVSRGDWPMQMLAEVLRAVYWFNPLVWLACRCLRDAGERACDDAVLNAGVEPADYASHLLDLARLFTAMRRAPGPALAMARSSRLEGRITAMLDTRQDRGPITSRARAAIAGALLALSIPVAIAAQNKTFTVSGAVVDQTNKIVSEVSVTLANTSTGAKVGTTSDKAGHFAFANVSTGQYELRAERPGFMLLVQRFAVDADVTRDLTLQLGEIHETVNVSNQPAAVTSRGPSTRPKAPANCAGGEGGDIVPPMKLTDVKPVYPAAQKTASGVVKLEATVGKDGMVHDVKSISSPNPEFAQAAIDAVKQWEFSTTYLNCTPVDLRMQVTVNFTPERK